MEPEDPSKYSQTSVIGTLFCDISVLVTFWQSVSQRYILAMYCCWIIVNSTMCVNNCPTRFNNIQFIYICKLLYMFRAVCAPIIRSSYHCHCHVQSRSRQVAVTVSLMPDTVYTVIWAPDDGWRYRPKHVEQLTDINKLYIVASCWIIIDTHYAMRGPLNIKNSHNIVRVLSSVLYVQPIG